MITLDVFFGDTPVQLWVVLLTAGITIAAIIVIETRILLRLFLKRLKTRGLFRLDEPDLRGGAEAQSASDFWVTCRRVDNAVVLRWCKRAQTYARVTPVPATRIQGYRRLDEFAKGNWWEADNGALFLDSSNERGLVDDPIAPGATHCYTLYLVRSDDGTAIAHNMVRVRVIASLTNVAEQASTGTEVDPIVQWVRKKLEGVNNMAEGMETISREIGGKIEAKRKDTLATEKEQVLYISALETAQEKLMMELRQRGLR